jgi:uncharacterized protein
MKSLRKLEARIRSYEATRALVAVSGGVDSAVVLAAAARALTPGNVVAVTAVSPSYPGGEADCARDVATVIGVEHRLIQTDEVERPEYARNDALRCFHCKRELFTAMDRLVSAREREHRRVEILAGANADDVHDFRPGLRAAAQFGVRNPLLETGLVKADVRAMARVLNLPVADKPALACLSSRVAFGVTITPDLLLRIDRAEAAVKALGFNQVRVRHFGLRATIEVPSGEVERLMSYPGLPDLLQAVRSMGWAEVEVDADGYRTGRMNATLLQLSRKP